MGLIIQSLGGIIAILCWILVLVKLFQARLTTLGVVSLLTCGLAGYVIGWLKVNELRLRTLMLVWTGGLIMSVAGLYLPGGSLEQARLMQLQMERTTPPAQ